MLQTRNAARGNSLLGANYALFIACMQTNDATRSFPSYIISGDALHYGSNVKTLCIALSAERRKLVREGRSWGIFTMNCCFTLCVLAATFVCLHAAPRLARSDLLGKGGSEKHWSDCSELFSSQPHLFETVLKNVASGWHVIIMVVLGTLYSPANSCAETYNNSIY